MNTLLHQIKAYLPNEEVSFHRNRLSGDVECCIGTKEPITILKDSTWTELKRHIDLKMSPEIPDTCDICMTDSIRKGRVTCPKCAGQLCTTCYVDIFRSNQGAMKCSYCNYKVCGDRFPPWAVEMGVEMLREKFELIS